MVDKAPEVDLAMVTTDRRRALAALHADHFGSLVATARWMLGDHALAEEVAQDAFVRLAESWDRLDDHAAAPAYLRRTVVNLSRSKLRRLITGRRKRQEAAALEPPGHSGPPGDELFDGELGMAIRRLPRRQQECVVLRFVHDLTVPDIAATLGIGAGSVKTHLHRALQTLGSTLGKEIQ